MKKSNVLILCILSVLIGAVGFYYVTYFEQRGIDKWFVLDNIPTTSADNSDCCITYQSEAIFNNDIGMAKIKNMSGRVKFIESKDGLYCAGYIVHLGMDKIDKSNIPDKYKKGYMDKGIQILPLDEVVYLCKIFVEAIDKDGFIIGTFEGPETSISSGKTNKIQGKSSTTFHKYVIQKIRSVKIRLSILKCETCS